MKKKKKPYFIDQEHAEFIRKQYCCVCGCCDTIDKRGKPVVTVSHITKKGMGGANKQEHNNLTPMCFSCHASFECWPSDKREVYRPIAEELTYMFLHRDDL